MWHMGEKQHFPQGKCPVRVLFLFMLTSPLQLPACSCRVVHGLAVPAQPSTFPSAICTQPLRKEQYGSCWAGAPESWRLQACFNTDAATGLNLGQHLRCWYLCWYQVWYLWLCQGGSSVCFGMGDQAREGVQQTALCLEKASFTNHRVCLILKSTANALSVASAVCILRAVPTVAALAVPGGLAGGSLA